MLKLRLMPGMTLLAASLTMSLPAGEQSFDLTWHTLDGGGGTNIVGGAFELSGTIGQPDAGAPMTGGSFTLIGGFWSGGAAPVEPCPADVAPLRNGDGVVNAGDFLTIINAWGACPPGQPCPADIAPPPNGDGAVNVADMLAVINAWGVCP